MVHLNKILDPDLLQDRMDNGYVRHQDHPTEDLVIFNYTNKAQFDNEWDDVTEQTRGLVCDATTLEVVSRPFRKFFNWDQVPPNMQAVLMNEPVETYVKWDGSLGILYPLHTGEHAIATRGSFTSPQAKHATELLRTRYSDFEPILGLTYLFEIIYPENRIVVDYKGMDDLVLLAVIDTETGKTLPFGDPIAGSYDWPGPINQPIGWTSLAEVLEAPQDANQEGFVVYFPRRDMRVKWKFDEYVRLHRIMTNVSTLSLWDALANGQGIEAFIDHVPDELYDWVREQVSRLQNAHSAIEVLAHEEYDWILRHVRRPEEDAKKRRKDFALLASESPYRDILFGLYDGKDVSSRIWKKVRPEYSKPFSTHTEDVA